KPVDAAQLQAHLRRTLSPVSPARAQALLVDDDADARAVMSQMLRVGGFDVTEASDGEEALELLSRDADIGLVVTDFCLPRGNGSELAIEVKRLYPKVKILLISGDPGVMP